MPVYQRHHVSTLLSRLAEAPERLIVVLGPRQTGKTTLIRQVLEQVGLENKYVPIGGQMPISSGPSMDGFDQVDTATIEHDAQWLADTWQVARTRADKFEEGREPGFVLVLDEVQKIPQWSETIKGLWDADRAAGSLLRVVVLGSAPLLMQQGLTESLAGRFELVRVNHWSFSEMVDAFDFDFESYVYFGGYPGAAHLTNDQSRWREYVRSSLIIPNIEKDVLSLTRVDKPKLLKLCFELGCVYSGQILSYTKMLGQLHDAGNTTTLAHYLDLMSTAGLLSGLAKYSGQELRKKGSSPKLCVLNTCFMAVLSRYTFEEAKADRMFWGRLVESSIGAHLFNTGKPDINLYYWRDGNFEVDYVLEFGRRLISVEVKSGPTGDNARGIAKFGEKFKPERDLLVGGQGIPLEEFLGQPAAHWFDS